TKKYPGLTLDLAQPKRSIVILEGALAAYCRTARARPAELDALEEKLAGVTLAIEKGGAAGPLAGKSQKELAALKLETENTIKEVTEDWTSRKETLSHLRDEQTKGTDALRELDTAIADQTAKEQKLKAARKAYHEAPDAAARQKIKDEYKLHNGEELVVGEENGKGVKGKFGHFADLNTAVSPELAALKKARTEVEQELAANKEKYADLLKDGNGGAALTLTDEHVLAEFSRLSHVPMNKLQQDESQKLLHLGETIKERVFGQDEPIEAVAKAVKRGRVGLKKPNKPIGSFLFLGPSGVGKTELAKALATTLFGDESALQIYNMSEYMEKHASAVLIGAPPGYEGHAEGGLLTNNMRRMPYCVNVFDEAEKADKQVFDLFLQIIDEGVLVDRRGVKASFANSINILTSNIGAKYFLDESLTFEQAKEKALADLWNPEGDPSDPSGQKGFRPEFLNRFTGIFCFNRLGQVEIIKIANKSLKELNQWVAENGISVSMPEKDLKAMCEDQYDPKNGGRGIMNYIENNITSDVADTLLEHPGTHGTVEVTYTPTPDKKRREDAKVRTQFIAAAAKAKPPASGPANSNTPPARKNAGPQAG
ncbi:MAG: AAA family ATPase, partial [Alphaproteobacteria bacterium]|nr:AAA family ATPase [Alphaproteobacteria bacterium]